MIESEEITAEGLLTVTEAQLVAEREAELARQNAANNVPTAPPILQPQIQQLFAKDDDPHINKPSGIATNGEKLFWGNELSGTSVGSIVSGNPDKEVLDATQSTEVSKNINTV